MSTYRSYQKAFSSAFKAEKKLSNRLNWLKRNLDKIIDNQSDLDLPKEKRIESKAIQRVLEFMFADQFRFKWIDKTLSDLFDDHVMCKRENRNEDGEITSTSGYLVDGNISAYYLFMYFGYKAAKLAVETYGNGLAKKDLTEDKIYNLLKVERKPAKKAKVSVGIDGAINIDKLRETDLGVEQLAQLRKTANGAEKRSITMRIKELRQPQEETAEA